MVELCAAALAALEHAAPRSPTDNARLQELGSVLDAQASAIRQLPDVSRIGQGTVPHLGR